MLLKSNSALAECDTASQSAFDLIVFQVPRLFNVDVVIGEPTVASFRSVRMHGDMLELKKAQSFMLQQDILCSMSSKGFVEAPSVWVEEGYLHGISKESHKISFAVFGLHEHEVIDEVSANSTSPIQSMIGCVPALAKAM